MTLKTWMAGICLVGLVGCGGHGTYHHRDGSGMAGHTSLERGKQEMSAMIDKTITDPSKAQRVKDLSRQIMQEVVASSDQSHASHEQLYTLNMRHDATREEFQRILDALHAQRAASAERILDLRFKMNELLTGEEWTALTRAMNDYRGKYHRAQSVHGTSGGTY